jgi:hypothetical protein
MKQSAPCPIEAALAANRRALVDLADAIETYGAGQCQADRRLRQAGEILDEIAKANPVSGLKGPFGRPLSGRPGTRHAAE